MDAPPKKKKVPVEKIEPTGILSIEDLIEEVSVYCEITKAKAKKVVFAIFNSMITTLREEGRIELRGFGVFSVKTRKPRNGYNPETKTYYTVPERKYVHFRESSHVDYVLNPVGWKRKW